MNPNDIRGFAGIARPRPFALNFSDFERLERIVARDLLGLTSHGSRQGTTNNVPQPVLTTAQSIEKTAQALDDLKAKQKAEAKAAKEAEQQAAERAEAKAARTALIERLTYEKRLAVATQVLLDSIRGIEIHGCKAQLVTQFAEFRDELNPLAQTYGFKLVLVGDKSVAVLTR